VGGLPAHGLSDVPAWVEDPVRWLVANQYMTGYPDGSFKPNLPITRGQVTRATFRIAGQPAGSPHPFTDVPAWLTDAVDWVAHDPDGAGPAPSLMDGYPGGTFRDGLDISRAQTIRLTCRVNAAPGTC
ncbi:MAG: S-layer homology domain-containing protein, partial [Actinomycetota bacterium]